MAICDGEQRHARIAYIGTKCPLCVTRGKMVEAREDARTVRDSMRAVVTDMANVEKSLVGHRKTIQDLQRLGKHYHQGFTIANSLLAAGKTEELKGVLDQGARVSAPPALDEVRCDACWGLLEQNEEIGKMVCKACKKEYAVAEEPAPVTPAPDTPSPEPAPKKKPDIVFVEEANAEEESLEDELVEDGLDEDEKEEPKVE
jgi:phage FluMu protein Com